jgi:pimeloyl-ACP methyl ester carboxylesterase
MTAIVMFVHGDWVTSACWNQVAAFFADHGVATVTPPWPGKDRTMAEIRADPAPLAVLSAERITEHYAAEIAALPDPPILVGHSLGALIVQILMGRGLGSAGVAIAPPCPAGVIPWHPWALGQAVWALAGTGRGNAVVRCSYRRFRRTVANTLPEPEAREAFHTHVTPESARIIFQAAVAPLRRAGPLTVDFSRADRGPLLLIAAERDRVAPPAVVTMNHRRYARSRTGTDLHVLEGASHWVFASATWRKLASYACDWLTRRHVM